MARLGMFCFLGRGHLDPTAALGRRLVSRGHHVTMFHLLIAQAAVRMAGLNFQAIDRLDSGTIVRQRHRREWAPPLKFLSTVSAIQSHAQHVLREGCDALRAANVDMVIADQMDLAAGTVAEFLGLPFINVSCGPPVYLDETVPAPYFGWSPASGPLASGRNRLGNSFIGMALSPVMSVLNNQRRAWGLPDIRNLNGVFSKTAIITQLPQVLEFKRPCAPQQLFYTGQFADGYVRKAVEFPWNRLNGKPLIYASMGTIRNNLPWVFQRIAHACGSFDVQLVLSLGAGAVRPADLGPLPGDPIVVEYAPQIDLIRKAALVINCAGLNTTLDCVSSGVPMVAIPVAEDQPGIAARIQHAEMGRVVPLRRLTVASLRDAIRSVLDDPRYRASARRLQLAVSKINGPETAADIIEKALSGLRTIDQPA